jgi:2'-5' RNA ligase
MPHINLLYPFVPAQRFDAVTPELQGACREHEPFELTLARFRSFTHRSDRHTIFLSPEPAEPIDALQRSLVEAVPHCDDRRRFASGFTPHLSVGQVHGSAEARDRLIGALQQRFEPVYFRVDQVAVLARGPATPFRQERRVALGEAPEPSRR